MTRTMLVALTALAVCGPQAPGVDAGGRAQPDPDRRSHRDRVVAGARRAGAAPAVLDVLRRRGAAIPAARANEDRVYVEPAGDLDGDGLTDLLDSRIRLAFRSLPDGSEIAEVTTRVDARRGRDAALLWSRTSAPGEYAFAIPARVGRAGSPGVLFFGYQDRHEYASHPDAGGAFAAGGSLTVTAVDGAGTPLWAHTVAGAGADAFPAGIYAGGGGAGSYLADLFDGLAGPATDLLVVAGGSVDGSSATPATAHVLAISGADGTVAHTRAVALQQDGYVDALGIPDSDGGGLEDVLLVADDYAAATTQLTAYRADTGDRLWARSGEIVGYLAATGVGDPTGDGRTDLALGDLFGFDRTSTLVDGATGRDLWTRPGEVTRLGPVDRARGDEVAVLSTGVAGEASIRVEAYDAAGRLRWRTTRSLPAPPASPTPGPIAKPRSSSDVSRYVAPAEDVDGDGTTDFRYLVRVEAPGKRARQDQGWIDGRTGRARRDPVAGLRTLYGAVDGRGTETIGLAVAGTTLTATVHAGDSGRLLWRVAVAVPAGASPAEFSAATLSRTRCADVLVTVRGPDTFQTIALGGADGAPLWSLTRDGGAGAGTVGRPAVRSRVDRNACR